ARIEQVSRRDVAERLQHRLLHARMLALELHEQPLGTLALEPEVAARRTAAADDRQLTGLRVRARFVLADVHQRPDDDVRAIVGDELRGHRLRRAGEERIKERGSKKAAGWRPEGNLLAP